MLGEKAKKMSIFVALLCIVFFLWFLSPSNGFWVLKESDKNGRRVCQYALGLPLWANKIRLPIGFVLLTYTAIMECF